MSTIEQNVKARDAANTLVELGITLGKDEGFEPEQVRHMWKCVMETAATLIGEKIVNPALEQSPPPINWHSGVVRGGDLTDDDEMPFGKHQGERLGDVPDGYFKWLSQQDWLEDKYPELLAYIQENGLD